MNNDTPVDTGLILILLWAAFSMSKSNFCNINSVSLHFINNSLRNNQIFLYIFFDFSNKKKVTEVN